MLNAKIEEKAESPFEAAVAKYLAVRGYHLVQQWEVGAYRLDNIFRDNAPTTPTSGGMQIDRKRFQKLREKKIALGHKPDDHEEEQNMGGMTMGGW